MKSIRQKELKTLLRPGKRVFVGGGAATPRGLLNASKPILRELYDIEVVRGPLLGNLPWEGKELAGSLQITALGYESGATDYLPVRDSEIPSLFQEGWLALDYAMVMVAPPDNLGFCSLGIQVDANHAACLRANKVIVQVNDKMPRTNGGGFLHESQIDFAWEESESLLEREATQPGAVQEAIARYTAEWVPDGATLHMEDSPLAFAILPALRNHRGLGIHTATFTDPIRELMECGAVDNSRKEVNPGQSVATRCLGSEELYRFVRDNPHVGFFPIERVCDPRRVARHARITCLHQPRAVSLTGESALPAANDFLLGAEQCDDGMIIACLPSRDPRTSASTIHPELPAHHAISLPDAVVTEYGAALLKGRSNLEKVRELLRVVHPEDRESLLGAARKAGLLSPHWSLPPPYDPAHGGFRDRRIHLKDGSYLLRLLTPADEDRLQEFFYSHTEETIHKRYGFTLRRMTRQRAFELVSVDQNHDLALGIFQTHGARQVLHAVGRYYLDPDGKSAEIAFVTRETKRRVGMGAALLDALRETAKARGLQSLWGQVDRDNLPMLHLFQQRNATTSAAEDPNCLIVRLV